MKTQEDILEDKWLEVKKHYEEAYKKIGFKFKVKPDKKIILDLHKKMIKLNDSQKLMLEKRATESILRVIR